MAEWSSGRDQVTRRRNLMDGTGSNDRLNGSHYLVDGTTVFQDSSADAIALSGGPDWMFLDPQRDALTTLLDPIFSGDLPFLSD